MKQFIKPLILWYLRIAANIQIWKIKPIIVGVAGSSGKSSLVKLLAEILGEKYSVRHTGGKNSEIGLPLNILGITIQDNSFVDWFRIFFLVKWRLLTDFRKYDIHIAEMGIDGPFEPYNMNYLLKIIRPTIGIVTNVGVEHSVYFDPLVKETDEKIRKEKILGLIAQEETTLLTSLPKNGKAMINRDDTNIEGIEKKVIAQKLTIGIKESTADIVAKNIQVTLQSFSMDFVWKKRTYALTIGQPLPDFYAYEFLFCFATALSFDIAPVDTIQLLQKHFSLPAGRFSVFNGIKNTTIFDSSYNNATLEPILGILDTLKQIAGTRRKIAIIGDMREQGSQSKENHEVLAEKIAQTITIPILVGPLMTNYVVPILKKKKKEFYSFLTVSDAKETILSIIKEKDIILVKGSQNTLFLERVVEMLLADKNESSKLCRRGIFWDKIREKTL